MPAEPDQELEAIKLKLFQTYLEAQEEDGFVGSFMEFLNTVDMADKARVLEVRVQQSPAFHTGAGGESVWVIGTALWAAQWTFSEYRGPGR